MRFRIHKEEFHGWKDVKAALKSEYELDSDLSLLNKLINRKQASSERIGTFISSIRAMNLDLDVSFPDDKLIGIIQRNLHAKFLVHIGMKNYGSDFKQLEEDCRRLENCSFRQQEYSQPSVEVVQDPLYGDPNFVLPKQKKSYVNVLENVAACSYEKEIPSVEQVSLLRPENKPHNNIKKSFSKSTVVCRNCNETGHFHSDCGKPKRLFCHARGKEGFTIRTCDCQKAKSSTSNYNDKLDQILKRLELLEKRIGNSSTSNDEPPL